MCVDELQLPHGWKLKMLSEIATIYNGNSINAQVKKERYTDLLEGYNYIGTKDVNTDGSINYENGIKIPFGETGFKKAPLGSVFVCSEGGSAGKKTAYVKQEVCFGNKLYAIVPKNSLAVGKFIFFYTRYADFFAKFTGLTNGIIGGVSATKFGNITIPIPGIEEQNRIVNRIEELFSELDKAEETLLKTKAQLEVYKQAVLKDAFEHNEEWQQYKFVELMESIKNGYGIKPTDDGEYPIFKISAVRPMHIVLSEIRYNKEPFEEAFLVHENDILVTRYNGSKEFVGCCGVVSNIKGSIGYPDKLIRCRPKINNQWHSKFIQYYLSQGEARKFIRSKIKTTSGQNGLAGGDLKKVTVKVPDLSMQKAIVENIEEKLIAFANIENTTNITLLKVKSLRQSILKEAFEGKLV